MNKAIFEAHGNQLTVTRTFAAKLDMVWRAWTDAELLDQWWAPNPWKSKTKRMNFEPGGSRLYAMCGPNGEEHWALTTYTSVDKPNEFSGSDAFCDEGGIVNEAMPVATFRNQFQEQGDTTTVVIQSTYASKEHLEQVIQMGMKEGLQMAFENLDKILNPK